MSKHKMTYFDEAWLSFVRDEQKDVGVLPGESTEKEPEHVCSYVNVGFQFDKWVCKECNKEKPS